MFFDYQILLSLSINTPHKILNDVFIVFNIASSHLASCPSALLEQIMVRYGKDFYSGVYAIFVLLICIARTPLQQGQAGSPFTRLGNDPEQ